MLHAGLDLSRRRLDVCVLDEHGERLEVGVALPDAGFVVEWDSYYNTFLFPPVLDELVPADHPVRYVAVVVDGLSRGEWLRWRTRSSFALR